MMWFTKNEVRPALELACETDGRLRGLAGRCSVVGMILLRLGGEAEVVRGRDRGRGTPEKMGN